MLLLHSKRKFCERNSQTSIYQKQVAFILLPLSFVCTLGGVLHKQYWKIQPPSWQWKGEGHSAENHLENVSFKAAFQVFSWRVFSSLLPVRPLPGLGMFWPPLTYSVSTPRRTQEAASLSLREYRCFSCYYVHIDVWAHCRVCRWQQEGLQVGGSFCFSDLCKLNLLFKRGNLYGRKESHFP